MSRTIVTLIPQKGYVGIGVGPKQAQLYFPYIIFSFSFACIPSFQFLLDLKLRFERHPFIRTTRVDTVEYYERVGC